MPNCGLFLALVKERINFEESSGRTVLEKHGPGIITAVDGEEIHDSFTRILITCIGVFFLGVPLGGVLLLGWWGKGFSIDQHHVSHLLHGLYGVVLFLSGWSGLLGFFFSLFRRKHLIISEDCLQIVVGKQKVVEQIPFQNIAQIKLIKNKEGWALVKDFIGIALINVEDPETLCPGAKTNLDLYGWHYRLADDMWRMPLEQIYDRLQKRLAFSREEPT